MIGEYKLIGVCISKIQEEYRINCIRALNHFACEHGYRILVFNTSTDLYFSENTNEIGEASIFQLIQYDKLDAMVYFAETLKNESVTKMVLSKCREHNIPVLTVDLPLEGCVNFSFDYSNTFEKLCRHVIEDHHVKRVFMMAGVQNNRFSEERVDAFRMVLKENGLSIEDNLVGYGDFWETPTRKTMENWFDVQKLKVPEAIICANDSMAIVVSKFLQDRGYNIPEDCIVTGFDGIMQASYHIPHLTTCTQDYEEMGRLLVQTIEDIWNGRPHKDSYVVDFHIIHSQSCGCEKTDARNVNDAMQDILDRLRLSMERQEKTCQLQSNVTSMSSLSELPAILLNIFIFHTLVFAINDDIFRAPDFGQNHRGENAFGENVNILYHRNYWNPGDPCIIRCTDLAPQLSEMLKREAPILFCPIHFMDLILGYCAFQPEINSDEYEEMTSFMNAINSSLGIFHMQMHTKSINMQLKSANNELERLYVHDHMTGLLNRRGFYRQIRQQMDDSTGKNLSIVLISADLDGLKYINDTFGHTEGDNAITTVGHALLTSAIQGEVCSRFGGDEFTVAGIIPDADQTYFDNFRNRFRTYLEQYNASSQKPYQVESSIGFCIQPLSKDIDLDQMIKIADDRMYEDKVRRKKTRR
ncbi:MAG: diguanylate cyclase domain-containing protein [Ruminococcus sp.]